MIHIEETAAVVVEEIAVEEVEAERDIDHTAVAVAAAVEDQADHQEDVVDLQATAAADVKDPLAVIEDLHVMIDPHALVDHLVEDHLQEVTMKEDHHRLAMIDPHMLEADPLLEMIRDHHLLQMKMLDLQ